MVKRAKKIVFELDDDDWRKLKAQAKANKRAVSREVQHIIEERLRKLKAEIEAENV